ncbi:tRNA (guanine-N(7)-)-methyltransferase [Rubripirellula amarantea]|uniref:tRNA (Guanine-N(7)-)-methyltransferase n=1 Tax=Rubripirellula amarantea TaxID=2527999 RepID=A0A5C5WTC4_9BACT|nr:class I SAM-dependent methyltransferase [Rubripirellula amarantea]TWT53411.1 tRNA (guanine-N(7)-)-methyltransferase [Rubripirellula amarantea]
MDSSTDSTKIFEYDQVAYPGLAERHIQLRCLEFAATMHGVAPADLAHCRVLELGCADGTNLIPFAVEFPESQFIGIDLASDAIRQAEQTAQELELSNIEFRCQNISDVESASIGTVDYVLCPGVFSWATDDERSAILRLCQHCLSADGIAAISFNTLPGWNWGSTLRDYVRFSVGDLADPREQIAEARRAIELMAEATPADTLQGVYYRRTREQARGWRDTYLYHEYISDRNRAFYFHDFQRMAEEHELRFVAEADFQHSSGVGLQPPARLAVSQASPDKREQLIDYFLDTGYRKSILCRSDRELGSPSQVQMIAKSELATSQSYERFRFDLSSSDPVNLPLERGSVAITDPFARAAIWKLMNQWPRTATVKALYEFAVETLVKTAPHIALPSPSAGIEAMSRSMLALFGAGVIEAFIRPPIIAAEVSEKPMANRLVRHSAKRNMLVVNQWHQNCQGLSNAQRHLLSLLDGTRNISQLAHELQQWQNENLESVAPPRSELPRELPSADVTTMLHSLLQRRLLVS